MPSLKSSITVVNRSGKVVSNSKHLVSIFKEAKTAYLEKRAELRLARTRSDTAGIGPAVATTIASSAPTSRDHSGDDTASPRPSLRPRPTADLGPRGPSSCHAHTDNPAISAARPRHGRRYSSSLPPTAAHRKPVPSHAPASSSNSSTASSDDLAPALPPRRTPTDLAMRQQLFSLTRLLDEAHCLQHSAAQTIASLERDPERMAAVALALAEVSALATRLAPGALGALAKAFPAALALLVSPEFLVAVGVGVGITVVALGGYTVVKKIRRARAHRRGLAGAGAAVAAVDDDRDGDADALEDVAELQRVRAWRRGVPDAERASIVESVEGEWATPAAARRLREEAGRPPLLGRASTSTGISTSASATLEELNLDRSGDGDGVGRRGQSGRGTETGKVARRSKETDNAPPSALRSFFNKRT